MKKRNWSQAVFKCPEASCDFETVNKYSLTRHCIRWHRGNNKRNSERKKRYTQEQVADDLKKLLEKSGILVKQGREKDCDDVQILLEKPPLPVLVKHGREKVDFKKLLKKSAAPVLVKHQRCDKVIDEENGKVFECKVPQCGLRYKSTKHLRAHERTHDASAALKCDLCDFETFRSNSLRRHRETHNKWRTKFRCKHCPSKFTRKDTLQHHSRTYHPNLTVLSPDAEAAVEAQNWVPKLVWKDLRRISNGAKPCSFPGCHFRSRYKVNFQRHMKLHARSGTTFKCAICQQKCARKDILYRHMRRVHSKTKWITKGQSPNGSVIISVSDSDSDVSEEEEVILIERIHPHPKHTTPPPPPPTVFPEVIVKSDDRSSSPHLPPPVLTPMVPPLTKEPLAPLKNNNDLEEVFSEGRKDCDFCNYAQRLPRYLRKHLQSCTKCSMGHGTSNPAANVSMYQNDGCEFVCKICGFVGGSDESVMLKHSLKHRKLHVKLVRLES